MIWQPFQVGVRHNKVACPRQQPHNFPENTTQHAQRRTRVVSFHLLRFQVELPNCISGHICTSRCRYDSYSSFLQDVGSDLLRLALRQAAPKVEAWMAELTE